MGPIGRPKTSVKDYNSTLHNSSEEHRSYMMIGDAGLGLALLQSHLVQHSPVWHCIDKFKTILHI